MRVQKLPKMTAKVKDKIREAKRQLLHRFYVSLIYNCFQNLTQGEATEDDDPYHVLSLDSPISGVDKFHSWDIVLYKQNYGMNSVDLVFIEVKSSSKNFMVNEYKEKVKQTLELMTRSNGEPLFFNVAGTDTNVGCAEFVIAAPPTDIDQLRNRFTETTVMCPVIIWGIDDGTKPHQVGKVAHIYIPYVTETRIKAFPMCKSYKGDTSRENGLLVANHENSWYFTDIKRSYDTGGNPIQPLENLTKNNSDQLLALLNSPNVSSRNYVPGRIPMIDNVVNLAILYLGGPLSGKGKDIAKSDTEWITEIDEYFRSFGLIGKDYGETYFKLFKCIKKLKASSLNPNSYYVTKPKSQDYDKFIEYVTSKVLKCIEEEHTKKITEL